MKPTFTDYLFLSCVCTRLCCGGFVGMGCTATYELYMYLFFWCGNVQWWVSDSGYVFP